MNLPGCALVPSRFSYAFFAVLVTTSSMGAHCEIFTVDVAFCCCEVGPLHQVQQTCSFNWPEAADSLTPSNMISPTCT
ncbi:hypothetical protein BKA56DRAFT_160821 [Ilyonectria sp. MPI-CAGE-AT-0026]|nr:hypothetical protein BKA56DRAFT_160821 [Ilyonectria sp. MPI-CAGE-AT-0026]